MDRNRPYHRFLSASVAFIMVIAPIFGFSLGIVADLAVMWWFGVSVLLGVFVGFLYSRQPYSLSRLWNFVYNVWTGLVIAVLAIAAIFRLLFRLNGMEVQELELLGRTFVGGVAFVVFGLIYSRSYQSVYIESA